MKKEFIVERNGRSFVLYAGLLDLAHERGLKAITTTLVQLPSEPNGMIAVCHATVETEQGTFTGLGDASPDNVSRMMLPHLIRMAETRAKARALRDAVNVGVTALEELGDLDDEPSDAVSDRQPLRRSLRPLQGAAMDELDDQVADFHSQEDAEPIDGGRDDQDGRSVRESAQLPAYPSKGGARPGAAPATPKQVQTIARMARAAGKSIGVEGLTRAQASEIISGLIGEMDQQRAS